MPKKIAIAMLVGLAFLAVLRTTTIGSISSPEPPQEPLPTKVDKVPEKEEKPVERLTEAQKRQKLIEDNPHNCDTNTQWIVWPDGKCSNKEVKQVVHAPSGSWVDRCHRWADLAGITLNSSAIKLLERESHCDPTARNPYSSAGGIPQALPWTKMGCNLSWSDEDAVCQLKWFKRYVESRYGSYEAALAHSYSHGWY